MSLTGGETNGGAVLRVGMTSYPQLDTGGDQGQAHFRGDTIRGQGGSKEEEGRSILGGYFC